MIQIHPNLTSNSQQAFSLENKSRFGEKKSGKIIYTKYEALFLVELKKAESKKKIKLNNKEKNNYLVFKDLRKKGYIVKTALKFGAEFRVYKKNSGLRKGKSPLHAKWLLDILTNKNKINLKDFLSKNRIAHSTGKKLLIAIIDSQQDITYFEISWIKP